MNLDNIHLIKGKSSNIIYHYPSYNILTISNEVFDTIVKCKSKNKLNSKEYNLLNNISSVIDPLDEVKENKSSLTNSDRKSIKRITLHVSNDCNLRCKYCYADGGSYMQKREIMTLQTAEYFVDFCINNFDRIKTITFFGGEPLLNLEVMEFICKRFTEYYKTGKSLFLPEFSIITNGTILSSKILQFLKTYISQMTISIDGPKEINDVNRVDKKGKGSFDRISNFIKIIKEETNISVIFEATITEEHYKNDYTHNEIKSFFKNKFGIEGVIGLDVNLYEKKIFNYFDTLDYDEMIHNNFKNMPNDFWDVLGYILNKEVRDICNIVGDIFAVNTNGTIYPCHMVNGSNKCSLGNIKGHNIFNSNQYPMVKFTLDTCNKCWAENLCGSCPIKIFYRKEKKEFLSDPNPNYCSLVKKEIEQILLIIAFIRKNPIYWSALVEEYNSRL